jgi:NHLM bacteriocin system ABC transporter ATP-binding protein
LRLHDDVIEEVLGLPGSRRLAITVATPAAVGDDEVAVVAEGIVEVTFVPVDPSGRPLTPLFVGELSAGEACAGARMDSTALANGSYRLRSAAGAEIVVARVGSGPSGSLAAAVAAWEQQAASFAQSRPVSQLSRAHEQLERKRALDHELHTEGRGALLQVFELRHLRDRPPGLPPVVGALGDAADATGEPIDAARLEAAARSGETDVLELAASLQLPVRRTRLEGRSWRRGGPVMVAFEGEAPVVLLPSGRGYVIRDAAGEEAKLSRSRARGLSQLAYTVYPKFPPRPVRGRDVLRIGALGGRRGVLALVALTVLVAALGAFIPYATAQIVGSIVPSGNRTALLDLVIAVGVFTFAMFGASLLQGLVVLELSSRGAANVTAALWDRLLHAEPSFLRGRSAGAMAQQVTAFDQMRTLLSSSLVAALAGAALSVSSIALLFSYSATAGLLVIAAFAALLAVAWAAARAQGRSFQASINERNRLNGLLLGLFTGISKLRVAGAERRAQALWAHGYALQEQAQRDAALQGVRLTIVQALLPGVLLLSAIAGYSVLQSDNSVSLVDFTGTVAAAGQLSAAGASIVALAIAFVQLRPLYRTTRPILEQVPEVSESAILPGEIRGGVELDNVTFGYDPDLPVLQNVSIAVEPGSFVALVGPSGAGKTTIVRLILGFDTPWQGQVLLDSKPLDRLDREAVRRRIGTVIQGATVTSGSILTNIIGALPLTQQDAWEAAEMAGVADDIRAMPMQMSTVISEGGSGFSGGQLQRILLARALVRKPRIVLLDEATSSLDNETQRIVTEGLGALGVTRIVIAHRLSTIRHADHIVVLGDGRVLERGRFEELIDAGGTFSSLARRQLL